MPLENAQYIDELVVSNPAIGDSVGRGDDHLRLLKQVLLNSFPNISGAVNLTDTAINALPQDIADAQQAAIDAVSPDLVPTGAIIMWSGTNANIPTGWALCDGTNGTPNLRDRFIVGSGGAYATGNTGGADSKSTNSGGLHNHGGGTGGHSLTSAQLPAQQTGLAGTDGPTFSVVTGRTGSGSAHSHSITDDGTHSHTVDVRPKYYALAFIMRVAS